MGLARSIRAKPAIFSLNRKGVGNKSCLLALVASECANGGHALFVRVSDVDHFQFFDGVIRPIRNRISLENQNLNVPSAQIAFGKIYAAIRISADFVQQSQEPITLISVSMAQKLKSLGAQIDFIIHRSSGVPLLLSG
jgi:hypothetical protein